MRDHGNGGEGRQQVTIEVYSRIGCAICEKAKQKLDLMGLEFTNHELKPIIEIHKGWREDGSVEILCAYAWIDNRLPVIRIGEDFHDYPGAMSRLKALGRRSATEAPRRVSSKAADGVAQPSPVAH